MTNSEKRCDSAAFFCYGRLVRGAIRASSLARSAAISSAEPETLVDTLGDRAVRKLESAVIMGATLEAVTKLGLLARRANTPARVESAYAERLGEGMRLSCTCSVLSWPSPAISLSISLGSISDSNDLEAAREACSLARRSFALAVCVIPALWPAALAWLGVHCPLLVAIDISLILVLDNGCEL